MFDSITQEMVALVKGGRRENTGGGTMCAVWYADGDRVLVVGDDDYTVNLFDGAAWEGEEEGMIGEPFSTVYADSADEAAEVLRSWGA